MTCWNPGDVNPPKKESKAAAASLSAYEAALFKTVLEKKAEERASARPANDMDANSLRYLFTIFH